VRVLGLVVDVDARIEERLDAHPHELAVHEPGHAHRLRRVVCFLVLLFDDRRMVERGVAQHCRFEGVGQNTVLVQGSVQKQQHLTRAEVAWLMEQIVQLEQLHLPVHAGIEVVVDELSDVILEVDDGGGQIPLHQHNRVRLGVRRYFPRTQAVAATAVCTFIVLASVLGRGDPRPVVGALQDEEQRPLCCVAINVVGVIN
jgi:hypothetical protein